jgi:hypothetical protein
MFQDFSVSHQNFTINTAFLLGSVAPLNICTFPQEKPGTSRWVTDTDSQLIEFNHPTHPIAEG